MADSSLHQRRRHHHAGRGGSDFTASIVGAGIGAEEIQMDRRGGMLTADPTILPGGHRVKTISSPSRRAGLFRAKVHPPRFCPPSRSASRADPQFAPARSARHAHRGEAVRAPTWSSPRLQAQDRAGEHHSNRMLMAHGFLHRIFEVFDRFERRWTWWHSESASRSPSTIPRVLDAIVAELEQFAEVGSRRTR